MVPLTRWVCCAEAVETATIVAKAAAVTIRIVLMFVLPIGNGRPGIHRTARKAKGRAQGCRWVDLVAIVLIDATGLNR
jgi:hypothetical protein